MGKGGVHETCNVSDNVGLIGHIKVLMGGYLAHFWEGGNEGEGKGAGSGDMQSGCKRSSRASERVYILISLQ